MMGLLLLTLQGSTAVRLMGGPLGKWEPTALGVGVVERVMGGVPLY